MDAQIPNLQAWAKQELDRANGIVQDALETLVVKISSDPRAYRQLMDPLLREACYSLIRGVCRKERRVVWNTPQPDAATVKDRIGAVAQGTVHTLMEFQLPGGPYMRDARKSDIEKAEAFYKNQSQDMGVKAIWFKLIKAKLPDDKKRVADVLTNADLVKLQTKARNSHA